MLDIMVKDTSSNTLCIGKATHTLTTPGLITKTYMPPMHCQTSIFQTLLQLDDLQYCYDPGPQFSFLPTSLLSRSPDSSLDLSPDPRSHHPKEYHISSWIAMSPSKPIGYLTLYCPTSFTVHSILSSDSLMTLPDSLLYAFYS